MTCSTADKAQAAGVPTLGLAVWMEPVVGLQAVHGSSDFVDVFGKFLVVDIHIQRLPTA
jgi:hypothetical protein